jgi:signal peptidase
MIRTTFAPTATPQTAAPVPLRPLPSVLLLPAPASTPAPERTRRHPGALRLVVRLVASLVTGMAVALALAFVASTVLGYQHFTVMSGSMEPTISTGDVVVDKRISPLDARVGDVVTFPDPSGAKRLISHRVIEKRVADGTVFFETKGDANNDVQKWTSSADGSIGRVVIDVPKVGYLLFWLGSRSGRLLVIVVPLLLLGAYELRSIFRAPAGEPRRRRARHARR